MKTKHGLKNGKRKQQGFTLIEIMVVVVILGILATVVVQNLVGQPDQAKIAKAKSDVQSLVSALGMYRLENHKYPTTDQGLQSLVEKPSEAKAWREGGYINSLPKDPWGNDYQYLNPGVHGSIDVFSYGADGADGGEGLDADIGNWSTE